MNANVAEMIETLRTKMATVNTIDPCGPFYEKLCKILDSCDDESIVCVAKQNIKFVSKMALNRVIRRGLSIV
jgi:hypothetical protein